MKQSVNLHTFREQFRLHERTNFSYEGLEVLFNGLIDFEESSDEEWELDVIALCCDFVEMSLDEVISAYSLENDTSLNEVEQWLNEETWVIGKTEQNSFIFQQF